MADSIGGAASNSMQKDRVLMTRHKLEGILEEFRQSLELFIKTGSVEYDQENSVVDFGGGFGDVGTGSSASISNDCEADKFCSLLKSRVGCLDFLEKLESAQASIPQSMTGSEEGSSWDIVNENDIWGSVDIESDKDEYVLVRQEDIVDGIACFMAAYLMSLEQTKDLTPNQIQEALSKTFSVKKRKGRLQKAWEGSKVIYNVASWGATAIGLYQNPAIITAASAAFWSSCRVISKLL
ncbi:hypothetical protein LIER_03849 [Lithospermum erythrorhizon]|uniref:Uncharacterized protein n=1 Tax=Lithospermum erythrorhizon TaxID=34254 RepID=A0AAV3NVD3_LITER